MTTSGGLYPVGWRNAGVNPDRLEMVDVEFSTSEYARAFIEGLEPAITFESVGNAVRDACVAEVNAIIGEYRQAAEKVVNALPLRQRVNFGNCIIERLESLTVRKIVEKYLLTNALNVPEAGS